MKFSLVAAMIGLMVPAQAGGEGWSCDMAAASKQATKEGKDLLLDFTGSDWCGWCIKLNKEVFEHEEFKSGVKDHFVLVEVDFPKDASKLSDETRKQNDALGERYAVQGYPTILLCDATGRPYASTGYQEGGAAAYVTHLNELRQTKLKRDEAFAAAAKLEGPEKAKALVKGLELLEFEMPLKTAFYGEVIEQISKADPKDESGYAAKLAQAGRLKAFEDKLNALAEKEDMDGAMKLVEATLAEGGLDGQSAQRFAMIKAMILLQQEHIDEGIAQMDKAIELAPESPEVEQIRALKQRVIEHFKQAKDAPKAPEAPAPDGR